MWRWWRRLFLLFLWGTVPLGVALIVWAWRVAPGNFLGLAWPWFAGCFLLGWSMMVLNFTLDLPQHPLPPEVPPREEVRRWLFVLVVSGVTAAIFTLLLLPPIFVTHWMRQLVWAVRERWVFILGRMVLLLVWVGWFMGVFFVLNWLADQPVVERFRRGVTQLRSPSAQDVIGMLRNLPLPPEEKRTWIKRLRREGLTPHLARELQRMLKRHMEMLQSQPPEPPGGYVARLKHHVKVLQERKPLVLGRYAALYETLSQWLELQEHEK